jgi:hypothetical protein
MGIVTREMKEEECKTEVNNTKFNKRYKEREKVKEGDTRHGEK